MRPTTVERPPATTGETSAQEPGPAATLLRYHRYAAELSGAAWQQAHERQRERLVPGVCDAARLRVVMLLIAPGGPGASAGEQVLAPCVPPARSPAPLREVVMLMRTELRQRERVEALQAQLSAERERVKRLSEQLEALKAIERSIHQRENGAGLQE